MHTPTARYKWYILALAALTHTVVVAVPVMSLPVLFDEIARDLSLDLVQVGWIWGLGFLTGIFTSLAGGALGDRFGTRRTLMVCSILSGVTGALRGLSGDFFTLALTAFLFGLVPPAIPMNVHKTCGVWFPGRRLGLANGVVSAGMALGFMLGSLLSATIFSPLLGGWRQVLFMYGALSIVVGVLWSFTHESTSEKKASTEAGKLALGRRLSYVARIRNVWLLGLTMLGVGGCLQGVLGYLPLYLRGIGWPGASADAALATFHAVSLSATIPIALMSDRLGSRKRILMIAAMMTAAGVALLAAPGGHLVWAAVIVAGVARDGFMAILMTLIIEFKAIGTLYAGTAIGMVLVFSRFGSLMAPPLGNSLAAFYSGLPFVFWATLGFLGLACLLFVKEERRSSV